MKGVFGLLCAVSFAASVLAMAMLMRTNGGDGASAPVLSHAPLVTGLALALGAAVALAAALGGGQVSPSLRGFGAAVALFSLVPVIALAVVFLL